MEEKHRAWYVGRARSFHPMLSERAVPLLVNLHTFTHLGAPGKLLTSFWAWPFCVLRRQYKLWLRYPCMKLIWCCAFLWMTQRLQEFQVVEPLKHAHGSTEEVQFHLLTLVFLSPTVVLLTPVAHLCQCLTIWALSSLFVSGTSKFCLLRCRLTYIFF